MRTSIREALFKYISSRGDWLLDAAQVCHILARVSTLAIRDDVIGMMKEIVELRNELYVAKRGPLTRVEIDPNVRVRGNQTFTGLEEVEGPIAVGVWVRVYERESGVEGDAWVTDVDEGKGLVYLNVIWSSLKPKEKG
jgi:hypothetical protein